MNGRVILGEQLVHNYGMTINRNIEGTDICYSEVLKRVTPKLNGYYMFESEVYIIGVLYSWFIERWCSSVPIVKRPTQKSSYVHISYVGASKEMKIVENYEMKLVFLTSPP